MLTLFEQFSAVFIFFWCGNAAPRSHTSFLALHPWLRAVESEAQCYVVLENITDYAYWISQNQLEVCQWIYRNKPEDTNSQILTLQITCEHN